MTAHFLRVRGWLWVCALGLSLSFLSLVSVSVGRARAAEGEADQARAFHERAKAAFALSHYAQAAEFFEKAFELRSDPALLYNAAQSHRLAGNKERALALYQNYLRVYGKDDRRASIESRIEELKRAIERDRVAGIKPSSSASSPSPSPPPSPPPSMTPAPPAPPPTAPVAAPPPPPVSAPPPPLPSAPAPATDNGSATPMLLTQPGAPPAGDDSSITRKPWFWIAVGGGVAVAVTLVLFLTLSHSKDPAGSFGQASGN